MKRLVFALAAAVLATAVTGSAYAAKPPPKVGDAPKAADPKALEKGKTDAPGLVSAGSLKCTVTNAIWRGASKDKGGAYDVYELACQDAPGLMVKKITKTGAVESFNCIKAKTAFDAQPAGKGGLVCELPENANLTAQLQGTFNKTKAKCSISQITYLGSSETAHVDRYEVACSEGGGFIWDLPFSGEPDKSPISCLAASSAGAQCKLTPKASLDAYVGGLAKQGDASCAMSNSRWVGADASGNEYIEIACAGKPGFMVKTNASAFVEKIDCVRAAGIGDGCKLTDMNVAKQGAASGYTGVLSSHGINCTPKDFKIIGTENSTNREVVEFACAESPFGIVILNPKAGSTAKFRGMDCIGAKGVGISCTVNSKAQILAALKPILTAVGKTCEPTDYAVLGPGDTDGEVVEVKCDAGQEGYVLDLPANRAKTIQTLSCTQAARGVNRCTIAGNH